jgi:hypothetical protein
MHAGNVLERPRNLALSLLLCGAFATTCAQNNHNLHGKLVSGFYQDDKISLRIPAIWNATIDAETSKGDLYPRGLALRKGKYILRLCTDCAQVSGIAGGRFSEIADLVQPWYRDDPGAKPVPCGQPEVHRASTLLDRVDFWYRRDVAHPSNTDADDCHEPRTTATVWYGSYFAERCPLSVGRGHDCGGSFLHIHWLTDRRADDPFDEMVIALTYDTTDLDKLPRRDDREVNQVLQEVTVIVRSVHFRKQD